MLAGANGAQEAFLARPFLFSRLPAARPHLRKASRGEVDYCCVTLPPSILTK